MNVLSTIINLLKTKPYLAPNRAFYLYQANDLLANLGRQTLTLSTSIMTEKKTPLSLPAIIKQEMMHDIMSGRLRPGDKIIEEEYAHRLNVSRAPVREAMLMLTTDGLATKIQNRGTVLRTYTLEEHIDLYHIRYFIEKQSLAKIQCFDTVATFAEPFTSMLHKLQAEKNDLRKINILNEFYHYKFILFSGSATFIAAYPSIYISAQLLQYPEYA